MTAPSILGPRCRWMLSAGLWLLTATMALQARQVAITIVHTTDLHGRIRPAPDYDGNEHQGGLLRCATVIEALRRETPDLLLVDCGDLYQGTLESHLTRGHTMNDALAWLGYDAWVLGNHEFDWGLPVLAAALEQARVPVLAANLGARPGTPHPLPSVRPYLFHEVDGIRVALVGLTVDAVPNWSRPDLLGDLVFVDSVQALQDVMPDVRAGRPDVMVLLVHQGYRPFGDTAANQINRIARHFPEFDLIVGGHSHQPIAAVQVNGVLYTQAGYHGIWVGKAELLYDTVARRVVERKAELIHVADRFAPHAGLAAVLQADLERAAAKEREEIGELARGLAARSSTPGQSGVQQLLACAMAEAVGAEVVLHGVLADEDLAAGPVTEQDLWRVVPYDNTIGVVALTPGQLQAMLEENADWFRSSQFMGVYGIQYELDHDAPAGERIRNLRRADGSRIHARARLRVALNSYVLASGGQRFDEVRRIAEDPVSRLEMTGIEVRDAVRDYLKRHSPLDLAVNEAVRIGERTE